MAAFTKIEKSNNMQFKYVWERFSYVAPNIGSKYSRDCDYQRPTEGRVLPLLK